MKITLDKAIIWLLPYLYLVSATYYWGYWGIFGLDAFNFYAISDLIKGVIYPMTDALWYSLGLFPIIVLYDMVSKRTEASNPWIKLLATAAVVVIGLLFLKYGVGVFLPERLSEQVLPSRLNDLNGAWYVLSILGAILSQYQAHIQDLNEYAEKLVTAPSQQVLQRPQLAIVVFIYSFYLLFLPGRSYWNGRENALRIIANKEFDYTIADSIECPKKKIYKFLGKAGDYYVLSPLNHTKRVVIKVDKLNPLLLENFSCDDTASVRRFKTHQDELALAATLVKQPIPSLHKQHKAK
jgi:hypothetical protein